MLLADISIVSLDGTVTPIYNQQSGASLISNYNPNGETNLGGVEERVNFSTDASQNTHYYFSDHLGSARMEFAGGGWPVSSDTYYPFGQEPTPSSTTNHYKYTGLEFNAESQLSHATFRQYSATAGRWMSPDPYNGSIDIANPQTLNRYSYVGNNALSFNDPSGLLTNGLIDNEGDDCWACDFFVDLAEDIGSLFTSDRSSFHATLIHRPGANDTRTRISGGNSDPSPQDGLSGYSNSNFLLAGYALTPKNAPKSPARKACEAHEVAYANRVQSDQNAGAGGRILTAGGISAATTAFALGQIGLAGGEFLEPIGGGIPGALLGSFVGGVVGGASGILTTSAKEAATGFFENHSIFGYGNTYQKTLNDNIQKHCGGL